MRASLLSVCVVTSLVAFSPAAGAEPVVITGGSGTLGSDITGFQLTGANTSLSFTVLGTFSPQEFFPGQTISFTAQASPEDFSTFGFPATVNGVNFGNVSLQGGFTFVTQSFIAPPLTAALRTFTAPGTLSGTLTGFATNDFTSPPLFSIDLTGQGVFGSLYRGFGPLEQNDRWFAGFLPLATITFEDPGANPTPEPASLLLLATGAAGLLARRRRAA